MSTAKLKFDTSVTDKLQGLGEKADNIAKMAVYKGAEVLTDEVKKSLKNVISGDSTGDLVDSLGVSKIKKDQYGTWSNSVSFAGYDRRGVPNIVKARVLESGSSKQKARPFFRPAVKSCESRIISEMKRIIEEELSKGDN